MKFEIPKAVEILSSTPVVIKNLLGGLSDEWLTSSSGDDKWSPFEVVGHLIHGEKTDWIPRARVVLAQGESTHFEPFDMTAHLEDSKGKSLNELLEEFATLRAENIRILRGLDLSEDQLDLTGIHPEFGEVTLRQHLSTWVVHDLTHIRQIVTELAGNYDDNVGPWRQYLSILS